MVSLSWKGVIIGAVVDIVSTNILTLPLTVYALAGVDAAHLSKDQLAAIVSAHLHAPALYTIALILGGSCSVLGGYVAGRIAKRDYVLNGVASSFLCVGSELLAIATGQAAAWAAIALLPVSPALGALGGYVAQRTRGVAPAAP